MSANFFAALDDSDDEAAVSAPARQAPDRKVTNETVVDAKSEERRKPQSESHAGRSNANRNTKYGRGGPPPQRDGKRQYDRRSGTGRGREIKKDGGGAHNWGSDAVEARANEGAIANEDEPVTEAIPYEATEEAVGETSGELEETELAPELEPEPEPEPEDNTLSYEEYMELKKQQQSENLKPVKVREVENEFANIQAKKAVEEDFLVMGGGKGKKGKKPKEKEVVAEVEVELGFRPGGEGGSNYRGGGGRGRGRGRGRFDDDREGGGRGRRSDRDERDGGGRGFRGDDGEGRGRGRGGRGRGGRFEGRGGEFRGGGRFEGRGGEFRGGGRFEGRGRGRGGRGRSGDLNVNDEHDFPSLG